MFIFITNTKTWPENPTLTALDPRTPAKTHHKAIMQHRNTFESHISLMNGRMVAPRCQALSKRSKLQCKKAALTGKQVCMFHGANQLALSQKTVGNVVL